MHIYKFLSHPFSLTRGPLSDDSPGPPRPARRAPDTVRSPGHVPTVLVDVSLRKGPCKTQRVVTETQVSPGRPLLSQFVSAGVGSVGLTLGLRQGRGSSPVTGTCTCPVRPVGIPTKSSTSVQERLSPAPLGRSRPPTPTQTLSTSEERDLFIESLLGSGKERPPETVLRKGPSDPACSNLLPKWGPAGVVPSLGGWGTLGSEGVVPGRGQRVRSGRNNYRSLRTGKGVPGVTTGGVRKGRGGDFETGSSWGKDTLVFGGTSFLVGVCCDLVGRLRWKSTLAEQDTESKGCTSRFPYLR